MRAQRQTIYRQLAERLGIAEETVREYLRELAKVMRRELLQHGEFEIPGLVHIAYHRGAPAIQVSVTLGLATPLTPAITLKPARRNGSQAGYSAFRSSPVAEAEPPPPVVTEARRITNRPAHNAEVVRIFYGTDRQPVASRAGEFENTRGDALRVGWCDVSIPPDHRLAVIERPRITRLEFKEDPEKHFVITQRAEQSPVEFWGTLKALDRDSGLLFIHGFAIEFDDAVYRSAQLAYDLEFKGVPLLYSWASSGSKRRYTADLGNSENTIASLKLFLVGIIKQARITRLHIVAHSMGNRALLLTLLELAATWTTNGLPTIENLFLTAPDVDKGRFGQIVPPTIGIAKRTTLYASSKDKALKASKRKQIYPRAGDADDIVVMPGLDSIDASRLQTDFLSHSYYGDHRSVVSDLHEVIRYGTAPAGRFGLRGVPKASPRYYEFKPSRT